jgi:hypothetical protein
LLGDVSPNSAIVTAAANGESPAYVKEQKGRHSIKVTVDIYGHVVPGANRGAVDRLDVTGRNSRATGAVGDEGGGYISGGKNGGAEGCRT